MKQQPDHQPLGLSSAYNELIYSEKQLLFLTILRGSLVKEPLNRTSPNPTVLRILTVPRVRAWTEMVAQW